MYHSHESYALQFHLSIWRSFLKTPSSVEQKIGASFQDLQEICSTSFLKLVPLICLASIQEMEGTGRAWNLQHFFQAIYLIFSHLRRYYASGQIIATSHDLGPQKVAKAGKSPYFREILYIIWPDASYFGSLSLHFGNKSFEVLLRLDPDLCWLDLFCDISHWFQEC